MLSSDTISTILCGDRDIPRRVAVRDGRIEIATTTGFGARYGIASSTSELLGLLERPVPRRVENPFDSIDVLV